MKVPEKNIEEIFTFSGLWGVESQCGLARRRQGDKTVVIVTELYQDNPGSSVTSVAASLAGQICRHFGIAPEHLIYIESTPDMHSKLSFYDEAYYRVEFDMEDGLFTNPRWVKVTKEEVEGGV